MSEKLITESTVLAAIMKSGDAKDFAAELVLSVAELSGYWGMTPKYSLASEKEPPYSTTSATFEFIDAGVSMLSMEISESEVCICEGEWVESWDRQSETTDFDFRTRLQATVPFGAASEKVGELLAKFDTPDVLESRRRKAEVGRLEKAQSSAAKAGDFVKAFNLEREISKVRELKFDEKRAAVGVAKIIATAMGGSLATFSQDSRGWEIAVGSHIRHVAGDGTHGELVKPTAVLHGPERITFADVDEVVLGRPLFARKCKDGGFVSDMLRSLSERSISLIEEPENEGAISVASVELAKRVCEIDAWEVSSVVGDDDDYFESFVDDQVEKALDEELATVEVFEGPSGVEAKVYGPCGEYVSFCDEGKGVRLTETEKAELLALLEKYRGMEEEEERLNDI